jgi:hypothetical protein
MRNVGPVLVRMMAAVGLVLAAAVVHVTAAPGEAQARCDGHTEVNSNILGSAGRVLAEEWPQSGTCNSNNAYHGTFASRWSGWRAIVYYQNNGVWRGVSCQFGNTCNYSYTDDNYHSYIHLCVLNQTTSEWYCGWGSQVYNSHTHRAYGVNWGY